MKREFWFVVGSQFLYGPEVLEIVDSRAKEIAAESGVDEYVAGLLPAQKVSAAEKLFSPNKKLAFVGSSVSISTVRRVGYVLEAGK